MAQTLPLSPSHALRDPRSHTTRLSSPSPRPSRSSLSASVSPPPINRRSSSPRLSAKPGRPRASAKENVPIPPSTDRSERASSVMDGESSSLSALSPATKMNGKAPASEGAANGSASARAGLRSRETSVEHGDGVRRRSLPSTHRSKSPASPYNGLPTLPTISDPEEDGEEGVRGKSKSQPPPPAPSSATGTAQRPMTRTRRSSSIKRKLSPGVKPTKVVDWEIPRKTLHSSIGLVTLLLNYLDPPNLTPLLTALISTLVIVSTVDLCRLRFPAFAEIWESYFGFLMRESERQKVNGVVWYLVGVIFVLGLYPRDVAVVSILTLSWSDTTASTIGRLWGRLTPPLPSNFPGVKALKFAPRKSLAGFLAATVTGFLIGLGFWWKGSHGRWDVLDGQSWLGLMSTAGVVGLGGAVVEALDLGMDDNLTLPILSGAVIWLYLATTNMLF